MIYFIRCTVTGLVKIGYTGRKRIAERLSDLQIGSPTQLEVLGAVHGDYFDEMIYHSIHRAARVHGEWFRLTADDLAGIRMRPARHVERECSRGKQDFIGMWLALARQADRVEEHLRAGLERRTEVAILNSRKKR